MATSSENASSSRGLLQINKEREMEERLVLEKERFENWIEIGPLICMIIYPIDGGVGYDQTEGPTYFSKFGLSNKEQTTADFQDRNLVLFSFKNKQAKIRNHIDLANLDDKDLIDIIQSKQMEEDENLQTEKIQYLDKNDIDVKILGEEVTARINELFTSDVDLKIGERNRIDRYTFNKSAYERLKSKHDEKPSSPTTSDDELNAYSQNFSSYSLVTEYQIGKLKSQCPKADISYKTFRPNLVVGSNSNIDYDEEDIIEIKIKEDIGEEVLFPIIRPCTHGRTIKKTCNADFVKEEPYDTLMKIRNYSAIYKNEAYKPNAPVFGINMEMDPELGDTKYPVFLGQKVYAKFKKGALIRVGSKRVRVGQPPAKELD